jgi:Uma2 family endonuclease
MRWDGTPCARMTTRVVAPTSILVHARTPTARAEERMPMHTIDGIDRSRRWTLEEMHALPDLENGTKYELVDGELWVTPGPTEQHNDIVAQLTAILVPYVLAQGLGLVYHPRAALRAGPLTEVEPDLMVRRRNPDPHASWETAPRPILVIEVASPSTRRRDYGKKRDLYLREGIPEYWIVDGDVRTITVVQSEREEPLVVTDRLTWSPAGAREPLTFDVARVFS